MLLTEASVIFEVRMSELISLLLYAPSLILFVLTCKGRLNLIRCPSISLYISSGSLGALKALVSPCSSAAVISHSTPEMIAVLLPVEKYISYLSSLIF